MCELRYNESSSSYEVALKIFIDDLEVGIKKEGWSPLNLGTKNENELTEEHLISYINKYLTIDVDGKRWSPQFIGKELSEDYQAVWCYLKYQGDVSRAKKYVVTNRILFDIFEDQRNIMDIKMNKTHKAYTILDPDHPSWSYTF